MEENKGFVTIGYGKTDLEMFIRTLMKYKVNMVIDVRSMPYSKFRSMYNREFLKTSLKKHNIKYEWHGDTLGGRPKDKEAYDEDGLVNYSKLIKTEIFINGLNHINHFFTENNVAIMCSEFDPMTCHRFLAISRELSKKHYKIVHIIDHSRYITQKALEESMISKHFNENVQLDLFGDADNVIDNVLEESYIRQNKVCGYRKEMK